MASKIAICNMALGWLGAPPIASLTENRPEARALVAWLLDEAREARGG